MVSQVQTEDRIVKLPLRQPDMLTVTTKVGIMITLNFQCHALNTVESSRSILYIYMALTHCGLVTPYGDIDLSQQWLR